MRWAGVREESHIPIYPASSVGNVAAVDVSVIVSTRNRGRGILPTLRSVLSDRGCPLEVIVVDQSSSDATKSAMAEDGLLQNNRVEYQRSMSLGLSNARNEGISRARAQVLAFTDDDCVVGASWATRVLQRFHQQPDMAVLFADVVAGPARAEGWIPEFRTLEEGRISSISDRVVRRLGFGANMAVHRSGLARVGRFDELLGAGAVFPAGEDTDFGYRALRAGLGVYAFHEPQVVHNGLRTGRDQIASGTSKYLLGLGAFCMKHVRCGDIDMLRPAFQEVGKLLMAGTANLIHAHRPSGWRGASSILAGAGGSWRYGVDRQQRLYRQRYVNEITCPDASLLPLRDGKKT